MAVAWRWSILGPMAKSHSAGKSTVSAPSIHPRWTESVQYVKGVGPKRAESLNELGIETMADLLMHLPRRYLDRSDMVPIAKLVPEQHVTVVGKVGMTGMLRGRMSRFEVVISDGTGELTLLWFKGWRYLEKVLKKGALIAVSGQVRYYHGLQMTHPDFEVLEDWEAGNLTHTGRIVPVYPSGAEWSRAGLTPRSMRRLIKPLVTDPDSFTDYLPSSIRDAEELPSLPWTLTNAHYPNEISDAERARDRLAFDEFFFLELTLARRRLLIDKKDEGRACDSSGHLARQLVDGLPFTLTPAQKRVIKEITGDIRSTRPMRRLLQGDVGAGKTVVAAATMALWVESGAQTALMVPTEILAEQHLHTLTRLFEPCGIQPVLMTGSIKGAERRERLEMIANGTARVIIGTHALISEGTEFHDLGMVIIDEQHRFGVAERQRIVNKGTRPDLLVMTATPIPRTLALTLYGDLDVSVLNQKPPQKGTIRTVWRTEDARDKIYAYINDAAGRGELAYIVYPLVEVSEKSDLKAATTAFKELEQRFPNRNVGLVHGRVKPRDRQAVMNDFYAGNLHILVATTVIEVGVDAPAARLMVIENAERFGLSQLHQLRGRIGRGPGESICVLMIGHGPTPIARERVEAMCQTDDGFKIAEEDLRLRGPGEFLGTRQSGLPEFTIAHLVRDAHLVEPARQAAFHILETDPDLKHPDHKLLRSEWKRRYGQRQRLLQAG
ncbi:MAG: ATP-dependent DNA helicase RecG [candidate division Zixibacteria bacterium]|nr:ATP-dependent DNA helicase RecG [candidate division Zixibacteria bacterium]